jgi:ferredoxin
MPGFLLRTLITAVGLWFADLLIPGIVIRAGLKTALQLEPVRMVPLHVAREYLGLPEDTIECGSGWERERYGKTRRRIPVDTAPRSAGDEEEGVVLRTLEDAFERFRQATGRVYGTLRIVGDSTAEVVVVAGRLARSVVSSAGPGATVICPAVARPFPHESLGEQLRGKKQVIVVPDAGEPLGEQLALTLDRAVANGAAEAGASVPYPGFATYAAGDRGEMLVLEPGSATALSDVLAEVTGIGVDRAGRSTGATRSAGTHVAIRSREAFDHALRMAGWMVRAETPVRIAGGPGEQLAVVTVGAADFHDSGSLAIDALVLPDGPRYLGGEDATRLEEGSRIWIASGESALPEVWASQPPVIQEAFEAASARWMVLRNGFLEKLPEGPDTYSETHETDNGQGEEIPKGRAGTAPPKTHAEVVLAAAALQAATDARLDPALVAASFGPELGDDPVAQMVEVELAAVDDPSVPVPVPDFELRLVEPGEAPQSPSLRDALRFVRTGRSAGPVEPAATGDLLPLHLHPFRTFAGERTEYPLLVAEGDDGPHCFSVRSLFDSVAETAGDGDEGESRRRLLMRLEARLRATVETGEPGRLHSLWTEALGEMDAVPETTQGAGPGVEWARRVLDEFPGDGALWPVGAKAVRRAAIATIDRHNGERRAALTAETDALTMRIRETLGVDYSRSPEAIAPEHLQASVGTSYEDELDFEAFSHILEETDTGERLPGERRNRLVSLLRILDGADSTLFGEAAVLDDVGQGLGRARADLSRFVRFVRAVRVAELEVESRFVAERHNQLFERFSALDLTADEANACPPVLVLADGDDLTAEDCGVILQAFQTALPIKILATVTRGGSGLSQLSQLAGAAMAVGSVYVAHLAASELHNLLESLDDGLRWRGPALISVHVGSAADGPLHPYLSAAAALESRMWPSFTYDPSCGPDWAARFDIGRNPSPELAWSESPIEILESGEVLSAVVPFTAADYLATIPANKDRFLTVGNVEWAGQMLPLHEYLKLSEAEREGVVPFLFAADEAGVVWKRIPCRTVLEHTTGVVSRWRSLQELAGIGSSHVAHAVGKEQERLSGEHDKEVNALRRAHDEELNQATSNLAERIVSNIAAGLLGVGGGIALAPSITEASEAAVLAEGGAAQRADAEEVIAAAEPETEAAAPVEEEPLVLDEAYIETPRCTTCNECTNINPRMFAYNENKQAFIKDLSAGSFQELVEAAEKCPVRIIHVGKPRDPDEPHLDDLIRRAEPFR